MRQSLKLVVPALAVALAAAAPPLASASTSHARIQSPSATLAGSVLPSVRHSTLLGSARTTAPVRVSLILRPSHPRLLAALAAQSSGRQGMSQKLIDALFRPAPNVRAAVASYMHLRGFRPAGSGFLSMAFTGSAAQANAAFGVNLANYRLPSGITYRAPSGAIHLPPSLAGHVMSVDGLSTLPLMQPLGLKHSKQQRRVSVSDCAAADTEQTNNPGSLQPQDLSAANAYDSQSLLNANDDGTGENIALVEFSSYAAGDLLAYQTCYGTSVINTKVPVDGGTTKTNGGDEVALDQEVVVGEAPGLDHLWTFVAPGSDSMAGMIDSIIARRASEHTTIISDSWGICEAAEFPSNAAATDKELQITAVAGVSFFAASGDDGSSDCARFGVANFFVDDPASQPYATGVGGTTLNPGTSEVAWGGHGQVNGGGGGGVSEDFIKPTWQTGTGVIRSGLSSRTKCGGKTHYCREVPDVALDADPNTGYVINCSTASCAGSPGWTIIGGTSGAAPLMAALTADSNTFSRGSSGGRMGYANPFLYHEFNAHSAMFNDITAGNNNILGPGHTTYSARPGYDMATGLGSVDAAVMATDLAAYTHGALKVHGTKITGSASPDPRPFFGKSVLSGTLRDKTSHIPLAGRRIILEVIQFHAKFANFFTVHTGKKGKWSFTATHARLPHRFKWHAVYMGEQGHRPAITPWKTLPNG